MKARTATLTPWLLAAILVIGQKPTARADELVILKDGTRYRGRITIESPTRLVLRVGKRKVTLDKSMIKERKTVASADTEFKQRAAKLHDEDVAEWRELGQWALDHGLKDEAKSCYEKILEVAPGDPGATKALKKLKDPPPSEEETAFDKARAELEARLKDSVVSLDFKRATVHTIMTAVTGATEIPVVIDRAASRLLKDRRTKLKFRASHSALRIINDITKHLKLDYFIGADKVTIGTRSSINKLRKKHKVKKRKAKTLTPAQAQAILKNSKHSLKCTDKPLSAVMVYLRKNTALQYLYNGPAKMLEQKVTFDAVQRTLEELLEKIFQPIGLDFVLQGNVIYIADPKEVARMKEALAEASKKDKKGEKGKKQETPEKADD